MESPFLPQPASKGGSRPSYRNTRPLPNSGPVVVELALRWLSGVGFLFQGAMSGQGNATEDYI